MKEKGRHLYEVPQVINGQTVEAQDEKDGDKNEANGEDRDDAEEAAKDEAILRLRMINFIEEGYDRANALGCCPEETERRNGQEGNTADLAD